MKAQGGRGCKGPHIRSRLYPPVLILQEAEWTPGPVWTKSSEKNSPLRHPGSKPGRPARNLVPCRLNSLAHIFKV